MDDKIYVLRTKSVDDATEILERRIEDINMPELKLIILIDGDNFLYH